MYRINVYIPIETEEPLLFSTEGEALEYQRHLNFLHPENFYAVEETDEVEGEVRGG